MFYRCALKELSLLHKLICILCLSAEISDNNVTVESYMCRSSLVSTAFWIITIEDTFKMVLPHDCMNIHMFSKVNKTVNNKEMLLQINV
jgi:hypothetical protein